MDDLAGTRTEEPVKAIEEFKEERPQAPSPGEAEAEEVRLVQKSVAEEEAGGAGKDEEEKPEGAAGASEGEEAVPPTHYADMRDRTGRPIFNKVELKLLTSDVDELPEAKRKQARKDKKNLQTRAANWKRREVEHKEEEREKKGKEKGAEIAEEAFTGREPFEIANAIVELGAGVGILEPMPELVIEKESDDMRRLSASMRALAVKYPAIARLFGGAFAPELAIVVTVAVVYVPRVKAWRDRVEKKGEPKP
jgi:hypothetical protein